MAQTHHFHFDPLRATLIDLQHSLKNNKITAVQILEICFAQIDHYNARFNILISAAPRDSLRRRAKCLDDERKDGQVRGPLHGIPIVLKDCIATDPDLGMSTTLGSLAFVGAKPKQNSTVVQKLLDAGMIIIGKGNMTELCGMKMTFMMPGWSAHGGQTLSPYVGPIEKDETILGHSASFVIPCQLNSFLISGQAPGGSSVGPAVAVSTGIAPISLGSETVGSIVTPATRQGLYAIKPTVGAVDLSGVYAMTAFFDSVGPMAKSASDLAPVLELLLGRSFPLPSSNSGEDTWENLAVGFANPREWKIVEDHCRQHEGTSEQMVAEYEERVAALQKLCPAIKYPIEVPDASKLTVDGEQAIMPIAFWEFKNVGLPEFIKSLAESPVRSLEEIIDFNETHKDKALPQPYSEQGDLIKCLNNDDAEEKISDLRTKLRKIARDLLEDAFVSNEVDIIAAPGDSALCIHAACAGYPLAAFPVGTLKYNGRPFGMCAIARANQEDALLRFMVAVDMQAFGGASRYFFTVTLSLLISTSRRQPEVLLTPNPLEMTKFETLISVGGPLFRLPGTSVADFSAAWRRHGQLVAPWFVHFGVYEYIQIYLHNGQGVSLSSADALAASSVSGRSQVRGILEQASGIALVRCTAIPSADGSHRPFGDAMAHPYFRDVVSVDERRFLHAESGATAVKGDVPEFDVPDLGVDEWRALAADIGAEEVVVIKGGKVVCEGARWEEWRMANGEQPEGPATR
ncbi:hypothetical protein JX266_007594 [Neoarthrinium moseri]|uniref:uncharacterized protein n=1 Tax=Neoarthrinium moseri TaxID=1658444 RepID=UPI001FDC2888|nr:uncharacterized protein JN550_008912 [Neoarthrinium moseri]KAI1846389.1 hypothetical protein JX266_007594 [Neoarthrinium moseri]KAI1864355.1 hypothetical protein JN550_008912 [Neoarthrinium moseri]